MSEKLLAVGRASLFLDFTAMAIAIVVPALRLRDEQGPPDAEAVALELVQDGVAQAPRREGDRWEIDVVRVDNEALGDQ